MGAGLRLVMRAVTSGLLLAGAAAHSAQPARQAHPDWVGVDTCKGCHQQEFEAWRDGKPLRYEVTPELLETMA